MKRGVFTWDVNEISNALKISEYDVIQYFTDGRRVSFILERRIAYEALNGSLAQSEGAGFDVYDSEGGKWEVRSITNGGIYFCPSYMVGSGRKFEEQGFLDKMKVIEGYIVSDVTQFPNIPFWVIPVNTVISWWASGKLGNSTKIPRNKALSLISSLYGT